MLTGVLRKALRHGWLLQFARQVLRIYTKAGSQISLKLSSTPPGQGNRHQHLHQKRNAKSNEYRPQQGAAKKRKDGCHWRIPQTKCQ
ncbi:hypothetical protein EC915_104227 [Pseudomonas sp. LP_7_YM]|nr:hypothetical protein EC915_104227 [Pseudomonas sp. LP_7_YM]